MSVYVDSLVNHGWKLGPNCHLIADTEDELHAFAASVGLKRTWFQPKSFPHYDLTAARRHAALERGAIALDRSSFVRKIRELRGLDVSRVWPRSRTWPASKAVRRG